MVYYFSLKYLMKVDFSCCTPQCLVLKVCSSAPDQSSVTIDISLTEIMHPEYGTQTNCCLTRPSLLLLVDTSHKLKRILLFQIRYRCTFTNTNLSFKPSISGHLQGSHWKAGPGYQYQYQCSFLSVYSSIGALQYLFSPKWKLFQASYKGFSCIASFCQYKLYILTIFLCFLACSYKPSHQQMCANNRQGESNRTSVSSGFAHSYERAREWGSG